ncbi:hypothetical protein GCM10010365_15000 [Streptomyces poonensis]|uniref:Uncharacterized protein n=2 Tax=Streptomyces poonensis TaxID=68255 RepID=A0A918PCY8_9ACTN|nr:hypothetical protein GCM10010365_15000 [Streptomyces poonensis]
MEGRLKGLQTQEDKLTDAVLAELVSEESARRKQAELKTQKAALLEEQAEIRSKLGEATHEIRPRPDKERLLNARRIYDSAGQADRRELVSRLVREIRVQKGKSSPEKI